jgi:GntR family transcriptional regulator
MIEFRIDARSGIPPYHQIVQQVTHALRLGMLREGDQLPTVKEVVAAVAINPNTVAKAYRELEHAGLVQARPGLGTFVLRSLAPANLAVHGTLKPISSGGWPRPGGLAWTTRASRPSSGPPFVKPRPRT